MNEEYEYSFKVKNIKDFLDYCENNNYKKEEESFKQELYIKMVELLWLVLLKMNMKKNLKKF